MPATPTTSDENTSGTTIINSRFRKSVPIGCVMFAIVYLAARAYDFETNLKKGDPRGPGQEFMTSIIRSRSLGLVENGLPHTGSGQGDPGLADPMARLFQNWNLVLKGQLGFNNPQTETGRFSLRSEFLRVQAGAQGTAAWREALTRFVVPNVLELEEFKRYCIPFTPQQPVEPAIVIPFNTTINFGENFFGWPAGGGDNDYDSTHFATKIRSVGVWFANYNNLVNNGMINTPRVYLVPVGVDIMRSPTDNTGSIREWRIVDQAMPVPFPLQSRGTSDSAPIALAGGSAVGANPNPCATNAGCVPAQPGRDSGTTAGAP